MSQPPAYFDALYERDPDPWEFATSEYEREKYDTTLAALPAGRVASALEVGCANGVFTQRLAARCDRLLALDGSSRAVDLARSRCAGLRQISFEQRLIPAQWPTGIYDLILLSEVLYFLDANDLAVTAARATECIAPGGCVVLVNWLGDTDTTLTGDAAATLFLAACARGCPVKTVYRPQYRLDILTY